MIFELDDVSKVKALFEGWEETLVYSCLQKVMGKVFVTDEDEPKSGMAFVGVFAFLAGEPDKELITEGKPDGFVIMIPQNEAWAALIEECYPDSIKRTRFAIKKDTNFDREFLSSIVSGLPEGYELRTIDSEVYDLCMKNPEDNSHFRDDAPAYPCGG